MNLERNGYNGFLCFMFKIMFKKNTYIENILIKIRPPPPQQITILKISEVFHYFSYP